MKATEETSKNLGDPIGGPGTWMRRTLQHRQKRVQECVASGPVVFEIVHPKGYKSPIERCVRCGTLRKFHNA